MTKSARQITEESPNAADDLAAIDTTTQEEAVVEQEQYVAPKGKTYLGTTKGGKHLQSYRCTRTGHHIVEFADGGQVPKELTGHWTRLDMLKLAVSTYLNK